MADLAIVETSTANGLDHVAHDSAVPSTSKITEKTSEESLIKVESMNSEDSHSLFAENGVSQKIIADHSLEVSCQHDQPHDHSSPTRDCKQQDSLIDMQKTMPESVNEITGHNLSVQDEKLEANFSPGKSEDDTEAINLDETHVLRRSQRASAKRAKEKIKGGDLVSENDDERSSRFLNSDSAMYSDQVGATGLKLSHKKLVDPSTIDASDAHFAIQMIDDKHVVLLSDESDVSSLNDQQFDFLKKNFEKLKAKDLTEEQMLERDRMMQELKTQLRIEEARLCLLKKVRQAQRMVHKDVTATGLNTALFSRPNTLFGRQQLQSLQNQNAGNMHLPRPPAYKAPIANFPQNNKFPSMQSTPRGLNLSQTAAALGVNKTNLANNQLHSVQPSAAVQSTKINSDLNLTAAQRDAAIKLAFRRQMEKTLLTIPPPKPPPSHLNFVPNPNQPEFLCMVGLDEIVERLLSLKQAHLLKIQKTAAVNEKIGLNDTSAEKGELETNTVEDPCGLADEKPATRKRTYGSYGDQENQKPFQCVQCNTDYTPAWKRVAHGETDDVCEETTCSDGLILCENCLRSNQKKALRIAHTSLLREKFAEALKQERDIEKQIKEGTFNFASLNIIPPTFTNNLTASVRNVAPLATNNTLNNVSSPRNVVKPSSAAVNPNHQSSHFNSAKTTAPSNLSMHQRSLNAAAANTAAAAAALSGINLAQVSQMIGAGWMQNAVVQAHRYVNAQAAFRAAAAAAVNASAAAQVQQQRQVTGQSQQPGGSTGRTQQMAADLRPTWQDALISAAQQAQAPFQQHRPQQQNANTQNTSTISHQQRQISHQSHRSSANSLPSNQHQHHHHQRLQNQHRLLAQQQRELHQQLQQQQRHQNSSVGHQTNASQRQVYLDMMPRAGQKWR